MSRSDMSGPMLPCWKKDKIRPTRARCSTASRRFARCEAVRCRAEFTDRWAASASKAENPDKAVAIDVDQRVQKCVEITHGTLSSTSQTKTAVAQMT